MLLAQYSYDERPQAVIKFQFLVTALIFELCNRSIFSKLTMSLISLGSYTISLPIIIFHRILRLNGVIKNLSFVSLYSSSYWRRFLRNLLWISLNKGFSEPFFSVLWFVNKLFCEVISEIFVWLRGFLAHEIFVQITTLLKRRKSIDFDWWQSLF